MRTALIIIVIALAAAGGWFFGRKSSSTAPAEKGERKIAFYQSPMHPWIKSEKPGNCTICGMKLSPVYEGEKGFDTDANVVSLGSNAINVINVQTEPVEKRALERTLQVAGRIESDETRLRVISAYVDGRIEKLFVNFTGAEVKAGEPLALLYSPALLSAQREYLTLLGQTNLAPALSSQHERLIEGARERLRRLGLSEEQIAAFRAGSTTNSTTMITAPMGGTVVTRTVVQGQYVKEGDKLFEIADLSTMWFRFDVYEQDLPMIRIGDVVRVSSPALGGRTFQGPITFIDPNINLQTRSARVRVELENPIVEEGGASRQLLFNGLYAEGAIAFRTDPVLAVSKSAVIHPGDHPRVFVDQGGGAYEHRVVKLGRAGEEYVEVLEGLTEGEKVATTGNMLIDSQAQLNRSAHGSPAEGGPEHHTAAPIGAVTEAPSPEQKLSAQQISATREYFQKFVFPLNEHLAADNLKAYNDLIAHAEHMTTPLAEAFANSPLSANVEKIASESKKLKAAADLDAARAAHNSFSKATVDFYQAAIRSGLEPIAKIFKCPMYPKLGQNAFWLQAGEPLRNPFFGSEMLECGVEVKL